MARQAQHGCFFCQNWDISKSRADQVRSQPVPPEDVRYGVEIGCESCVHYNEPTSGRIHHRYFKEAKKYGLKTVMVTNGYITYEASTTFTITLTRPTWTSRPSPRILRENHADASSAGVETLAC